MGTIHVFAERVVDAPAATVYGYLADMREHHPRFLPPAFSAFEVETGGVGEGTIIRFTVTAGGRSRGYRMTVTDPEPGRVLTESDTGVPRVLRAARLTVSRSVVVGVGFGWRASVRRRMTMTVDKASGISAISLARWRQPHTGLNRRPSDFQDSG
jgi:hypothetical protein